MLALDLIAEQRIREGIARGELEGLPGEGRPLVLDDDRMIPPEMRLAWRVLKNAGYVPEEVSLRREIGDLETLLVECAEGAPRLRALRRLELLRARLEARRGHGLGAVDPAYRSRIVGRLARS